VAHGLAFLGRKLQILLNHLGFWRHFRPGPIGPNAANAKCQNQQQQRKAKNFFHGEVPLSLDAGGEARVLYRMQKIMVSDKRAVMLFYYPAFLAFAMGGASAFFIQMVLTSEYLSVHACA
jgi:hypothetical protein